MKLTLLALASIITYLVGYNTGVNRGFRLGVCNALPSSEINKCLKE